MSAIYEDPSLAANLHLVMLRIFYLDTAFYQVPEQEIQGSDTKKRGRRVLQLGGVMGLG